MAKNRNEIWESIEWIDAMKLVAEHGVQCQAHCPIHAFGGCVILKNGMRIAVGYNIGYYDSVEFGCLIRKPQTENAS